MNNFSNIFCLLVIFTLQLSAQPGLPCGHSHNDYLQKRPLYEAVELGYGSIEIDICLTGKKELKVAHIPWFLSGKKEVDELYFAPIVKMIEEKDARFTYSKEFPLNLLIDFKKNADSTYKYLKPVLIKYAKYITRYKNGTVIYQAPLVINITGNQPWKALMADSITYALMDGPIWLTDSGIQHKGFKDIDTNRLKYMGRVANDWQSLMAFKKHFKTEEDFFSSVKSNLQQYHQHGLTTRFHGVPNNEKAWAFIDQCGAYWFNVDELKRFKDFFFSYRNRK
jgi:hypothetical protein